MDIKIYFQVTESARLCSMEFSLDVAVGHCLNLLRVKRIFKFIFEYITQQSSH